MTAEDSITRAIDRIVLASRCLDGASDDPRAFARNGGLVGNAAADVLEAAALRIEGLALEIAPLEDA